VPSAFIQLSLRKISSSLLRLAVSLISLHTPPTEKTSDAEAKCLSARSSSSSFVVWCFRHQLLLGCHTHPPNMEADWPDPVEERECDIPRQHHKRRPTRKTSSPLISNNLEKLRACPPLVILGHENVETLLSVGAGIPPIRLAGHPLCPDLCLSLPSATSLTGM
jgi:hypothetical protein